MRRFRIQLLLVFLLSLLLMACSNQNPKENELPIDTEQPILVLTGGDDLETTSNSIVIEGQLSDNVGITSFTVSAR